MNAELILEKLDKIIELMEKCSTQQIEIKTIEKKTPLLTTDLMYNGRAINVLNKIGVHTIEDLEKQNRKTIERLNNIGRHTMNAIDEILQKHNTWYSIK